MTPAIARAEVRAARYAGPLDPVRYDPVLRHADARRNRG